MSISSFFNKYIKRKLPNMSKIKNYQKLDKNSVFSNCSYA
jgi:hypothetical protein